MYDWYNKWFSYHYPRVSTKSWPGMTGHPINTDVGSDIVIILAT